MGFLARESGERVGDMILRVWITGDHEATCAGPGDVRMAAEHHGYHYPHYLWATTAASHGQIDLLTRLSH